ncbi:TVP38/TMEM64 family protein [Collinsella phocaeensis]|uniref:TVP38/TMEM64 family protein n=1 Tax=Collinsella phocaeensis TaxID=1871016 RepID=UPI000A8E45D0|nr:VTT domain-containing protein [Collinsella phocaeensis]
MGFKQMVPVPEAETPVVSESAPARRPVLETATARLRDDRARGGHRARLVQGSAPRRRARLIAFAALAVVAVALAAACVNWLPAVYAWLSDPAAVRAFVAEHAVLARLAIVGVNVLQIVLAFLPGEPVELASGYALGFFEGTAACLAASAIGTSIIYLAVRRWGHRVVDLFFDQGYFERFDWLHRTRRLELIMLAVFLIPGTPKDFLTYFAGLTDMRFGTVLAIATFGRIPSIVTSTIAASSFASGDYGLLVGALAIAALLIAGGGVAYRYVRAHAEQDETSDAVAR